jgi:hypothetical protein
MPGEGVSWTFGERQGMDKQLSEKDKGWTSRANEILAKVEELVLVIPKPPSLLDPPS